jgi:hypothetical protein
MLLKHADSLAKFDAARLRSQGIRKISYPAQAATLAAMLHDGRAIRWDQNRKEVKKRAGDSSKFMLTLATRRSGGIFVCYWNGKPIADADGKLQLQPTKENPIVIYEGGHRSGWLDQIFNNTATVFEGLDMETLSQLRPDSVEDIRSARITLDVNTHESGIVPIEYIKEEYEVINTTGASFSAGEIVAASTDEIRNELQALIAKALSKRKVNVKKVRDVEKAEWRALANGALGQVIDMKNDSLNGQPAPAPEAVIRAKEIIEAFAEGERQVIMLFTDNVAVKKRIDARTSDFKMDATFMIALAGTVSPAQRIAVISDYVNLYRMFFSEKTVWGPLVKDITGGGGGKHSGNSVLMGRWKKIVNKVRPAAAPLEGEALVAASAV